MSIAVQSEVKDSKRKSMNFKINSIYTHNESILFTNTNFHFKTQNCNFLEYKITYSCNRI